METFWNFVSHLECPRLRRFSAFREASFPNTLFLVLEPRWGPLPCPFYPPTCIIGYASGCIPAPLNCSSGELLSLAFTSSGSFPDAQGLRYPPQVGCPKHPVLILLIAHAQSITNACTPFLSPPEYKVLKDRYCLLLSFQHPAWHLALTTLFELTNKWD